MEISAIGLDLAKYVFEVHGVDGSGRVVLRRQLRRGEVEKFFARLAPCVVGMEAGSAAHHWARVLMRLGHEVRLMPAQYVRPYRKRHKNDAADAAAICEALGRPSMRFVAVKTAEQQAVLMQHRVRDQLVGQRTALINALRGHLAEFGIVAARGRAALGRLRAVLAQADDSRVPALARGALCELAGQLESVEARIGALEAAIVAWHRENEASRRLATIPGIGPLAASAIVATVGDASQFATARHFAAWIGLVPNQHSSGGKPRLGRITKAGDAYLRRNLIHGARAVLSWRRRRPPSPAAWLGALLARRHVNVVTVALANKNARVAWALLRRGGTWRGDHQTSVAAPA